MKEISNKQRQCRGLTHFWQGGGAVEVATTFVTVILECSSCATVRHITISTKTGKTIKNKYGYSEGYIQKERRKKSEWRRDFVRTMS